ncbi:MAG: SDR family oxidoreductase [Rhodospirillaceae bacterium]|jgi:3-oxoacyl-[acyl-carrier protein] reductase|nr:SDR family oxidoreductase [Rhodospirillaceae bacterium]MBT3628891.1 SDR family oxidoreductase [Rhodospirillaceae bacterium]MBT3928871.1 SDR family oxidoreductase [Rhodospirillaceae bacterium]MBT4427054.1 SDR family oxidoreductase [Rhodospirillaceae bacterium]MBT5040268.1 SDR family oxidoreductase [Rhodospirillaceae bacterium]
MDLGISGKHAIVCASSKGLGRACAMSLAENGVSVVINGRDQKALDATARDIEGAHDVEVIRVQADVSTPEGQRALLEACPNPDILINNNGGPPFKDFRELSRDAMVAGVTMNMITPIELIQKVIDGMAERRFGRIVNVTSLSVKMPIPGLDLSSGARAGLTSFLAGVAPKVAEHNVTINNILPGFFLTDRQNAALNKAMEERGLSLEEAITERAATVPAKRFGDPAEFGEACAFLCAAQAGYITGQNLLIDGGRFPGAF